MASRNKKPHLVLETPDNTESSSSSEASDNSDAEEEELTSTDELQVKVFAFTFDWTLFLRNFFKVRTNLRGSRVRSRVKVTLVGLGEGMLHCLGFL